MMKYLNYFLLLTLLFSIRRTFAIKKENVGNSNSELMYWFFDNGGNDNGDYQINIHSSVPQLHKDLNFELPFYGFRYNYTRISLNGYLEFTDPPEVYTKYPLKFPRNYPKENDPSFIGPFYSKARIGALRPGDLDKRRPGVYFRVEENLPQRTDQFGVELRQRVSSDIQNGRVMSNENFQPKHVLIATWKNVSFQGGIDRSIYITNTFQLVVATDEQRTFAIFNYLDINWTTHTEAGGDANYGEGGVPAFVGFNAGRGQRAFEYLPYSQSTKIKGLTRNGCANGLKGRHIFRIDTKIEPSACSNDMDYVCHLYLDQN